MSIGDTIKNAAKGATKGTSAGSISSQAGSKLGQQFGGDLTAALGQTGLGAFVNSLMRSDPDTPYNFAVEIDGMIASHCREIGGLKMTIELEAAVQEGGNNLHPYTMIKGAKWEPLVLKRGFYGKDSDMYAWMRQIMDPSKFVGSGFRKGSNMSVIMMNDAFSESCRFDFYNAFPIEFSGPKLDATAKGQVAFEEIKIQYDYFEFESSSLMVSALGGVASAAMGLMG